MPYLSSNIQVTATISDTFKASSKLLIKKLIRQGGKTKQIIQTFRKFCDTAMPFINFEMY